MTDQFIYDGSFAGLLTAIFDVYEQKKNEVVISKQKDGCALLHHQYLVITSKSKAARVWNSLKKKIPLSALKEMYYAFLSEEAGIETVVFYFVKYVLAYADDAESYVDRNVLVIKQAAKKVSAEKQRFRAFVRLNKLSNGLFYAMIEPDYNILPLIAPHFIKRYTGEDWLIYDVKRKYGIRYNKDSREVSEVTVYNEGWENEKSVILFYDEEELHYQALWKNYYKNTVVTETRTMKLHLQNVPKHYWKYLPEKKK